MKYSKLQLNLPHPGIHSIVLMNLHSGRQGEERIQNTLAGSISRCPVHRRSPIPFVIKGINILPPVSTLERGGKTCFPLFLLCSVNSQRMQILKGL